MRFLLLLLFLYPIISYAQFSVQGQITDNENNTIPFSQVVFRNLPDSTVIKTGITDSVGYFKITTASRVHLLQVTAMGYEQQFLKITDTISENANLSIVLSPNTRRLKTISVVASKPLLERKADRVIFNVGSSVSSIGSDVYDLLKKAPGVRVSENNGISIAGKSTVSVMIDNKLQQLGNSELVAMLRSMSADNVDKIEVITAPPARYDAQGNSGIINIVTKKSAKDGFNGSINLGYQQRTRGSKKFGENLNYRHGRINIYSTGNTNDFEFQSQQKTIVPYKTQLQSQVLDQRNQPFYNRYQLGIDYNITSKAVIGALYTIGSTNRLTDQLYNAPVTSLAGGSIDSTLRTIADEKEEALRHVINLNYEWQIDTTGKKLNVDADHFTRTETDYRDFSTQTFFANGAPVSMQAHNRTTAKQKIDISSVKADVVLPYDALELTFGAKVSSIHTISDNRFSYLKSNEYIADATRSNQFDYTENTQAVYISASKEWNKWESQLGLRAENTQTKGISYTTAQTVTNNYLLFFPTAYLRYSLNDNNVFNINYSRRVGRPSYEELNPFRQYGSGTSYETGNPFLQPSFYHTVELSYSLKSKYIFTAYTGIVNNIHARISRVDTANNTFFVTNDNAGSSYNAGVSAMLVLNPFDWWESSIQAQGFYDKVSSTYYNAPATVNGITAWQAETNNTFLLNNAKTLLAEARFEYISRFQYDFVIQSSYYVLTAGVKALFFDKQLVLAINASDILRSETYAFRNIYNDVQEESYYDARCVNFSLNWKFGNKKIKAKRQRDSETEEIKRSE